MKLIAIVGSNNSKSFTRTLTYSILQSINDINDNFEYEILFLYDHKLNICRGCELCFEKGECPFNGKDDFLYLKKKMLSADIVWWSSPVYVCDITSIMKIFIERLSISCHTLEFAGILGFTLATTKRTGVYKVSEYLNNIQTSIGIKNIGNFHFVRDKDNVKRFIQLTANEFKKNLDDNFCLSSMLLESNFLKLKTFYQNVGEAKNEFLLINKYELDYWSKDWIQQCQSFQEYTIEKRKRKLIDNNEIS